MSSELGFRCCQRGAWARVWAAALTAALMPACTATTGGGGDGEAAEQGLAPEAKRVAFQSQCAQNVIECTSSWPTAVVDVPALAGQTVTETAAGFVIEGAIHGAATVQLVGSNSDPGAGAQAIFYSWSNGATDDDPATLAPGTEFSMEADPLVTLRTGFHYIRLTVENDIVREQVVSPDFGVIAEEVPSFDFVEVEVDVR